MRPLTEREKRILRIAVAGIMIYLAMFYGGRFFEKKRSEYQQLVTEARNLRRQVLPYENKVQVVKKMMDDFHMDPAKLHKVTVVAEASAALQNRAKTGGVQLGPIRESLTPGQGRGLATVQLEGSGQIPAVLAFLGGVNRIGFPVIVDSVQLTSNNRGPGQVKLNLTIIILDFEGWKGAEVPHA